MIDPALCPVPREEVAEMAKMSASEAARQGQRNLRGIGLMIVAMTGFVLSDAILKMARRDLEAGQILLVRGVFSFTILIALMIAFRRVGVIRHIVQWQLVLRGVIEGIVALLFITALGAMALADITAVLMVAPLLITAISVLFFREQVGWRRWLAVLAGFCGVLMVLQPGGNAVPLWAGVMAALSALGVACRDLLTRRIPAQFPSLAITLTTTIATTSAGGLMMLATIGWQPLSLSTALLIAGAACCVLVGNYAVIEAHRDTDLSVVSPFRFSVILLAVLLGITVFGEIPNALSAAGSAIIIASGLYTAHRENVRRKLARAQASDTSPR